MALMDIGLTMMVNFDDNFLKIFTELVISLDKRLSYGTGYGRSVAVRLLEYYQQSRKILKAVVSMKSAVSKDWLGLGATQAAMSFELRIIITHYIYYNYSMTRTFAFPKHI